MKRKNLTRNALISSVISLLLCVSMLLGTTFAWFTDEVTTGMNTIAAGNLDIELLADGTAVNGNTKLFDGVEKWEPGVVVYENLQVANVGTLALKYQMTLNFGNENDLNGHKLSEVLKVAVLNETIDKNSTTRAQVLDKAKAAVAADKGMGSLSNFYMTGELEAGKTGAEQAIVIFWEPNANDVDNQYNANNGQQTSDKQPLHIDFGVNLQATQKMSENDSFGNDYDGEAAILPKATVNNLGVDTVSATLGIGGAADEYALPFKLQFLPNETEEQAKASDYRLWHADYVVKADKYVPANSIALLGYYDAWCQYNNDNWVAMVNEDTDIAANQEVRLVEHLGMTVNYEEICKYGNDPEDQLPAELEGFLCAAKDLTGANNGTTITVELRMYEVPAQGACSVGGGCKHPDATCETGNYEVIGTYSYTFVNTVSTAADLKDQLAAGNDVTLAADIALDNNDTITIAAGKDVTIDLNGHKLSATADKSGNQEAFLVKGNLTVKNGSMEMTALNNQGWGAMATVFDVTAGGVLNLDGVTANTSGTDMSFCVHLNNWGEVTLNAKNSTFKSNYVAVRVFNSGYDMNNVTLENCYLEGASNALWVHNYTAADFGTAEKAEAQKALLNFNLTGNTLVGNPAKAGPIRLGMTDATYGDETILP